MTKQSRNASILGKHPSTTNAHDHHSPHGLVHHLKQFDVHSTAPAEFRVYTWHGAALSVGTLILIAYLTVAEAIYNFQIILTEQVDLYHYPQQEKKKTVP